MEKNVFKYYNKFMLKIIEGNISCKAVLEEQKRRCEILYVDKKKRTKDFAYIISLAKRQGVKVQTCTREVIDEIATGKTHGGMILKADKREDSFLQEKIEGFLCYVNGVEDPYNLGSLIRSLYASGCNALILPYRDWSMSENIILRASAGAYERLPIYFIHSDEELVEYVHKYEIPLYCAYRNQAKAHYEIKYPNTCCVAIGGALRGLSAKIVQSSNQNIVIEYGRDFKNALDTPSATAVIAFEIMRQKKGANNVKVQ